MRWTGGTPPPTPRLTWLPPAAPSPPRAGWRRMGAPARRPNVYRGSRRRPHPDAARVDAGWRRTDSQAAGAADDVGQVLGRRVGRLRVYRDGGGIIARTPAGPNDLLARTREPELR